MGCNGIVNPRNCPLDGQAQANADIVFYITVQLGNTIVLGDVTQFDESYKL
jgi:hypothetical protein